MKTVVSLAIILALCCCSKKHDVVLTRSFLMGVTPWPADFTDSAVASAYAFINQHCDLVSHHFDDGIPYEEAFRMQWPSAFTSEVSFRRSKTSSKKVFLSVAPLDHSRTTKAAYYSRSTIDQDTRSAWEQLPIDDPQVITAYVNFVDYLIDQLDPVYVNYGVESNEVHWSTDGFIQYRHFISEVYQRLKSEHPQLPLFISFMVSENPAGLAFAQQLMPYTDIISLSAYPYISASSTAGGNTDPGEIPTGFFEKFIDLSTDKPWGFAETAYIAQDLDVPSFSLQKHGTVQWQNAYLHQICNLSNSRKAQFLIWFCHADYDAGNNRLRSLGLYEDLFAFWQDTGLVDEHGDTRPAFNTWLTWMSRKWSP